MNIWQVVLIGLTYFNKLIQVCVLIKLWLKGRSNDHYDSKNNMFENQWKIAETIYTPFQNGHFWPFLSVSWNIQKKISEENSWNQLNNWKKSSLMTKCLRVTLFP
jgi:hypothetical protein